MDSNRLSSTNIIPVDRSRIPGAGCSRILRSRIPLVVDHSKIPGSDRSRILKIISYLKQKFLKI